MNKIELVGTAEAAELLGINKQNFTTRIKTKFGFPKPVATLRMGPIWLKGDILRWKNLETKR